MLYEPFHAQLTIDPKGRLTLPVQVRGALSMQGINKLVAVASQGRSGGIALFTLDAYRSAIASRTRDADPFDPRATAFLRTVVSTNQTLTIDGNGRLNLPPSLRDLVSIDREVVMFSMAGWFEVWDRARWDAQTYPEAESAWEQEQAEEVASRPDSASPAAAEGA